MLRLPSTFIVVAILAGMLPVTAAQNDEAFIIFTRNGALYAQAISGGDVTSLGSGSATAAGLDVYSLAATPLTEPPRDGYGFHHGVWSLDAGRFAYLELAPPHYRVWAQNIEGSRQLLLDDHFSGARGYLDPIGWTATGEVVLLERALLNHLHQVKVWRLDPVSLSLTFVTFVPVERLSGRSAMLPDGVTVFLGYNLNQGIGFLMDIASGQTRSVVAQLSLPPATGFEYYPLQVIGALSASDLAQFQNSIFAVEGPPQPFLHWPLPDEARSITCYPDSAWTAANFDVICPGPSRQNYVGHEGTDIGGNPNGLPLGTSVYPAAPGVVVAIHTDCVDDNPSCNNSYGNTVTLEHILTEKGQAQVWYTGYGHLQTVLVEREAHLADLTQPLGLSGATGIGGAHLHFEVRSTEDWVDPWDNRAGHSLWLGSNAHPLAVFGEVEVVCTSTAGNNIRSGPGTLFDALGKTEQGVMYDLLEIAFADEGQALGDWYRVQYEGGEGWLWFRLLDCS